MSLIINEIVSIITVELEKLGLDDHRISLVLSGRELYGFSGVLDSVKLVELIAGLNERIEKIIGREFDLFEKMDGEFLGNFLNINSLSHYLAESIQHAPL
ncbi:hypothetical protein PCO86_13905 [Pectobacteriaceae bacterium CE70]|uniref:hypothetical protein n=1 Tax=Pectobacteriaceae TaxID=1903410 RepID=UPI0003925B9B|nr:MULTISPECIES: hypothetical protein [Enterobacterales]WJV59810.1 hypothetical protein PCO84_08705 [Pectobacteriaceae bacterium C111]WJV64158.1 hypothetical protein PCO87_09135 [Pectobacteriaceae bacterium C52]WJV65411.1 hypothetical protein PCO86_13905 [Pectobacteriaceae bacterium CE70]WJY09428.1 hypothetical protein PCO80_13800 [Pectobacteriaceae bacterium C80]WJV55449.1 hypothetical protein PCO85_08700 [Prodigiosinella sp. LS101]